MKGKRCEFTELELQVLDMGLCGEIQRQNWTVRYMKSERDHEGLERAKRCHATVWNTYMRVCEYRGEIPDPKDVAAAEAVQRITIKGA